LRTRPPMKSPTSKHSTRRQHRASEVCEQAAAICYRFKDERVEFLLVRTRGGRWTFPKGSIEPGLTRAQSAALEAFEEAGVHGRIEQASFARYLSRKRRGGESGKIKLVIRAYLCEVRRLVAPEESKRRPTWFSADMAKQSLQNDRTPSQAAELVRVVDRALSRVERLLAPRPLDALQRVQFQIPTEADIQRRMQEAGFIQQIGERAGSGRQVSAAQLLINAPLYRISGTTCAAEAGEESAASRTSATKQLQP
jgi:8-oxo-dGTP pyrophosphatase MutT (NUDIX family)